MLNKEILHKKKWFSFILLLLLGILWGSGYTIARFAVTHGVKPLGYAFWQTMGPLLFLLIIQLGLRRKIPNYSLKQSKFYFWCGLFGIAIPNTNVYFTAQHLPSGLLAVIINISPVLTCLLAWLFRIERFSWGRIVAVGIGFIGILLLILPKASLGGLATLPWASLALLTPICFAAMAIYIAKNGERNQDIFGSSIGMLAIATIVLTPIVLLKSQFYALHWPLNFTDHLIILEILLSGCGYLVLFKLLKIAGAVYYSLVDSITIITALGWGFIFYNEKLNMFTLPAVLFILLAIVLIGLSKQLTIVNDKS